MEAWVASGSKAASEEMLFSVLKRKCGLLVALLHAQGNGGQDEEHDDQRPQQVGSHTHSCGNRRSLAQLPLHNGIAQNLQQPHQPDIAKDEGPILLTEQEAGDEEEIVGIKHQHQVQHIRQGIARNHKSSAQRLLAEKHAEEGGQQSHRPQQHLHGYIQMSCPRFHAANIRNNNELCSIKPQKVGRLSYPFALPFHPSHCSGTVVLFQWDGRLTPVGMSSYCSGTGGRVAPTPYKGQDYRPPRLRMSSDEKRRLVERESDVGRTNLPRPAASTYFATGKNN